MIVTDETFQPDNPFPSSPVVQLRVLPLRGAAAAGSPDLPVSVGTRAHTTLWDQVTEYLERAEETTTRGRVLALIGNLGLGKSHLAQGVATGVRETDPAIPVWVIDQPSRDMGAAYRDQLAAMYEDGDARRAFEAVVEAYHARVTAAALEEDRRGLDDRTRREFVQQLRNDELDSRKVVHGLGIDEELIHRHLSEHLREVTGNRQYATALALLLDPRFQEDVWHWLKGGPPGTILAERGIGTRIDGILGVFDALTVFGFLHGQAGRPYVLIVDALESALRWPPHEREDFLNGFESLVNSYANRGGLLVMCTQPEPWSELPPGMHERVLQIWPDRMDRAQTEQLVDAYLRRHGSLHGTAAGTRPLFTPDAFHELTEIDNGVPRRILKTCRRAWQLMARPGETRTAVDGTLVHDAVRALNEQRAMPDVHETVERALTEVQRPQETRPPEVARSADPDLDRVTFWVRVGEHAAIAILVVPSVLVDGEIGGIDTVSRAARAAFDGGCRTLVVVNGSVSRTMRNQIAQYIGTAPLLIGEPRFDELLRKAVTTLADRLADARQGGREADLWQRLAAMSAEQTRVLESVRHLGTVLERGGGGRPALPHEEAGPPLPAAVGARFADARAAVEALFEPPAGIRQVFTVDASGRPLAGERPRRLTFEPRQLESLGLLSAVDRLLTAFRDSVDGWWRVAGRRTGGPGTQLRDSLSVLCRSFEISMEVLPALEPVGVTPGTAAAARRADARDLLNRLGESVLTDLLGSAGGVTDGEAPSAGR